MNAWKRPDGRYIMIVGTLSGWLDGRELMRRAGIDPEKTTTWIQDAGDIDWTATEKVFGVITGPSSCGCEPAGFRWVGEREVEAGRTNSRKCQDCSDRKDMRLRGLGIFYNSMANVPHQCDIIEVMGEPDVAEATYDIGFRERIEGLA